MKMMTRKPHYILAVSVMSGDTNMSSVTREIQEEEEKSKALEAKMKHDLEKLKVRSLS